jgi:hypothetical protein
MLVFFETPRAPLTIYCRDEERARAICNRRFVTSHRDLRDFQFPEARRSAAHRLLAIRAVNQEARTAHLAFSSEEPVQMWYGTEILSHARGAMRVGERQKTMPILYNHNMNELLGLVEEIWIEDKRGRAKVRFGKDELGDWAMTQAADGILVNTSMWYRVYAYEDDAGNDTQTAVDWETLEVSLVTVPADPTVGVGR